MLSDAEALVQLALQNLACSQKELALRMSVSPTQITLWKKGEHISKEMEDKLRSLAGIGGIDPVFVLQVGSLENANKWKSLISYLANLANESAETGYDTHPLEDDLDLLCSNTFNTLMQMGVELPKAFPTDLDFDYETDETERIFENPYSSLIYKIFKSFTDVYGFYLAYAYDLVFDDELDVFGTVGGDIDSCLLQLAASKVELEGSQFSNSMVKQFQYQIRKEYTEWLNVLKEKAFRAGVPLKAELLDMVYESHDALGHEAEAESLGFNSKRLHPDIYMNELLQGMRVIHQVLPAIMKKLGIDDFKLDMSDLG